jgi:hypothetical protein
MWRFRGVLSRLGLAAASLSAVRSARQVVLPLWGVSIGLDAQTIALVVGISGAIDFALFYASGQVMDRFGRLWAALPAMVLMGRASSRSRSRTTSRRRRCGSPCSPRFWASAMGFPAASCSRSAPTSHRRTTRRPSSGRGGR